MTPHVTDGNLQIYKITCGPYDNNAYLTVCNRTKESIIIDTPADPEELIAIASTTNVTAILITHNHTDHLLGFDQVTGAFDVPVGIGGPDAHALPVQPGFLLEDGKDVNFGDMAVTPIFTPGHTDGSTCLRVGNHLFSGDTLFPGGPGKSRSPEPLEELVTSIESRLLSLPKEIDFYPGHGSDGKLSDSIEHYQVYASKQHPADLYGDVEWLNS